MSCNLTKGGMGKGRDWERKGLGSLGKGGQWDGEGFRRRWRWSLGRGLMGISCKNRERKVHAISTVTWI